VAGGTGVGEINVGICGILGNGNTSIALKTQSRNRFCLLVEFHVRKAFCYGLVSVLESRTV